LLKGTVVVRVAALFWEVLRDRFIDWAEVAGVRVLPSQAGRVTVTLTECPSSDVGGRRLGVLTVRRLAGRAAAANEESAETRRLPNLAFAEDSRE
jgi:hypothetical protein